MESVAPIPAGANPWPRRALWLVSATAAYNVIEAVIAVWAGADADSIALVGFGLDSVIETAAAGAVMWRMGVENRGADHERVERTEHRVLRFVGATFLLLAAYITLQALVILWTRRAPDASVVGIVLAVASLVIMPALAVAKLRVARAVDSRALIAEAKETLACAWLSAALLMGLAANAAVGWWWADPLVALAMVPWLVREGREAWAGDSCDSD